MLWDITTQTKYFTHLLLNHIHMWLHKPELCLTHQKTLTKFSDFRLDIAFFPLKECASQFYSGTLEISTLKKQKIHPEELWKIWKTYA